MATVLSHEAYQTPYCGLPPRVKFGKFQRPRSAPSGRAGTRSDKKPGPGFYAGPGLEKGYRQVYDRPPTWSLKGTGFETEAIGKLGKAKVPGPGQYAVAQAFNATTPRVAFGKMLPPRKRPQSAPPRSGPPIINIKYPDEHMAAPDFRIRKTEAKKVDRGRDPGPGAYTVKYVEPHQPAPDFRIRKTQSLKALRTDQAPGPGYYKQTDYKVFTRGTKWSQLHGVGRSSLHGSY